MPTRRKPADASVSAVMRDLALRRRAIPGSYQKAGEKARDQLARKRAAMTPEQRKEAARAAARARWDKRDLQVEPAPAPVEPPTPLESLEELERQYRALEIGEAEYQRRLRKLQR
jgi:hypothetical protein